MSILFTSDWQTDWQNLDKCHDAWNEVLKICDTQNCKYICILGDLKQAMNPVDCRIITWWQNAIRKAAKNKLIVLVLLGNHDRVGAYSNADNWLSILRRAGAVTFDNPGQYKAGEITLHMLPYTSVSETRVWAKKLAKRVKGNNNILCFHQDLIGAQYNQQGSKSDVNLTVSDLSYRMYDYVIGGHVHLPQLLKETKNVYYVGSPFCHDFGEVNQIKRYIVIRNNASIESINSSIPGWFDSSIYGFTESTPSSWKGTRIRVSVSCDASQDYGRRLEKARRRAEKKYKGAEIYVVPKFKDRYGTGLDKESITSDSSDERKLRLYVRETKVVDTELALDYMVEKLSKFNDGLRTASKVKFIKAKGHNFLSFKDVELDLTKKGIVLIQGVNEDRNNKSNGSGKTSLVQLLPVCDFGHTFKYQKADHWANRWKPKEQAFAEVIREINGKVIKVVRGRRPPSLRMYVDGKDVSSGMRSTDRDGTQQQIEKVTGFTWQTLANAVYIDRSVADSFLSGTNKQRTDVLSRFQNLERFERALKEVKEDISITNEKTISYKNKVSELRGAIEHTIQSIKDIKKISDNQLRASCKAWMKASTVYVKWIKKNKRKKLSLQGTCDGISIKYKKELDVLSTLNKDEAVLSSKYGEMKRRLVKAKELEHKRTCPTCFQKVKGKWSKVYQKGITIVMNDLRSKLNRCRSSVHKASKIVNKLSDSHDSYEDKVSDIKNTQSKLDVLEKQLRRQYEKLQAEKQGDSSVHKQAEKRLKALQEKKQELKHKLHKLDKKRKLYEYALVAFSRDGIPAFLNRQLCPVLNKSAAYYSELFSSSEIGVLFSIEKGEFTPEIINIKGGKEIDDQSTGERALAGLIASFALREVAPSCNLLILDEPGDGLDEGTARQFARSLRTLVKRFKAIYIATHNPAILSELGNERTITVRKKNKISRLEIK